MMFHKIVHLYCNGQLCKCGSTASGPDLETHAAVESHSSCLNTAADHPQVGKSLKYGEAGPFESCIQDGRHDADRLVSSALQLRLKVGTVQCALLRSRICTDQQLSKASTPASQ